MTTVTLIAPTGFQGTVLGLAGTIVPQNPDGTATVDISLVPNLLAAGWKYFRTALGWVRFAAPIAAELVSIVAAALPVSGTAMTIAGQPDYPRKLQVRGVYSGAVAGLVVNIVGTDGRGNTVSETVNVAAASSTTFATVNAYSHVTSVTPVGTVTNVTTIGVGVGTALAMPLPAGPSVLDFTIYKANLDAADVATANGGTIDLVAGTVAPATAANATHNYDFWWTAGLAD